MWLLSGNKACSFEFGTEQTNCSHGTRFWHPNMIRGPAHRLRIADWRVESPSNMKENVAGVVERLFYLSSLPMNPWFKASWMNFTRCTYVPCRDKIVRQWRVIARIRFLQRNSCSSKHSKEKIGILSVKRHFMSTRALLLWMDSFFKACDKELPSSSWRQEFIITALLSPASTQWLLSCLSQNGKKSTVE